MFHPLHPHNTNKKHTGTTIAPTAQNIVTVTNLAFYVLYLRRNTLALQPAATHARQNCPPFYVCVNELYEHT